MQAIRFTPAQVSLTDYSSDYEQHSFDCDEDNHTLAVQMAHTIKAHTATEFLGTGIRLKVAKHLGLVVDASFHKTFNSAVELTNRSKQELINLTPKQYRASFTLAPVALVAGQDITLSLWNRICQG
jgi:hypothetical protein